MAGRGGYQAPRNPAPVSGPGRLARRTDGGPASQNVAALPNAGYGESAEFESIQGAAPMSASPPPSMAGGGPAAGGGLAALLGAGGGGAPAAPPTPLTAPTERPEEPLTAGAPIGPGPGPSPEVMAPSGRLTGLLERLLENDITGEIGELYENARRRGL